MKILAKLLGIILSDSNINEAASHGYVAYRIKPVSTLSAGTGIMNSADIFFDFNPAISTNYVWTYIDEPTSLNELRPTDLFSMYPNPVADKLHIIFQDNLGINSDIQIFDISGRLRYKSVIEKSNWIIDTGNFDKGMYFIKIIRDNASATARFIKV